MDGGGGVTSVADPGVDVRGSGDGEAPGRLSEAALLESEERARLAIEAAELGTFRFLVSSGRLLIDERARRHLGIDREEVGLEDIVAVTHPDDRARVAVALRTLDPESSANRVAVEHRVVHLDGEVRWVAVRAHVRIEGEGDARRVSFGVATSQDITDRKRAEQALRASEERYRALVENIDGVVFSSDVEGRLTFVSGGVARYGWSAESLLCESLFPHIHPDDRERLKASREERLDGAPPAPFDFRVIDDAGKVHQVQSRTRPMTVDGKVVGLTGVMTDLTQQRLIEDQLRQAQKMEAIGRLAGGVAHDFNNLLNVIGIYTELAMDALAPGDSLRADLDEVHKAGIRAQALTRQLLAFSRKQILKPEPLELNVLIEGVSKMLGRLIGEDVALTFEPGVLGGKTLADPGQIEQVLMNLIVNARDAMPRGGAIRIETRSARLAQARTTASGTIAAGDYVTFAVTDTGTGIPEETRARIFEPFFTTKTVGKGTGLGLAMVYGIVEQSGGGIEVESALGVGTTFRIYLPAAEEEAPASTAAGTLTRSGGGAETVLVVEDEAALRHLTRRVLATAGYDVLVASDADDALVQFAARRTDIKLLVTDVVMPRMDGYALGERLQRDAPSLKVLYVSGYSSDVIANRGGLAPGVDLLQKPFTAQVLLANVRRVLDQH
jgi:PAS domain S-box-containing protein